MDLVRSGEIYNIKAFQSPRARQLSLSDHSLSLSSDKLNNSSSFKSNSRFQDLFLASPRAQELVSTMDTSVSSLSTSHLCTHNNTTPDTSRRQDSFSRPQDHNASIQKTGLVVNMAEFFKGSKINKSASTSCLFSPCKPNSSNENILKIQVSEVIDRLEMSTSSEDHTPRKGSAESADSGFNELPADSGRSSVGLIDDTNKLPYCPAVTDTRTDVADVNTPDKDSDIDIDEVDCEASIFPNDGTLCGKEDLETDRERLHTSSETMEKSLTTVQASCKSHTLKGWHIKALKTRSQHGIFVEGQRDDDPEGELWHSTVIKTRVGTRLVETRSKSQYHLVGPINRSMTLKYGFSIKFVRAFRFGFPSNWEKLVEEHFKSAKSSDAETENDEVKPNIPQRRKSGVANQQNHHQGKTRSSYSNEKYKTPGTKTRQGVQSKTDGGCASPVEVELKRSRSGRLIKPPLAWWRGQRIRTDGHHNLTRIESGGEEHTSLVAGLYDYDLKLPEKKSLDLTQQLQCRGFTPKVAKFDLTSKCPVRPKGMPIKVENRLSTETSDLTETGEETTTSQSTISLKHPRLSPYSSRSNDDSTWKPSETENERKTSRKSQSVDRNGNSSQTPLTNQESIDSDNPTTMEGIRRNISFSDDNEDIAPVKPSPMNTRSRGSHSRSTDRTSPLEKMKGNLKTKAKTGLKKNDKSKGQLFRAGLRSQDKGVASSSSDSDDDGGDEEEGGDEREGGYGDVGDDDDLLRLPKKTTKPAAQKVTSMPSTRSRNQEHMNYKVQETRTRHQKPKLKQRDELVSEEDNGDASDSTQDLESENAKRQTRSSGSSARNHVKSKPVHWAKKRKALQEKRLASVSAKDSCESSQDEGMENEVKTLSLRNHKGRITHQKSSEESDSVPEMAPPKETKKTAKTATAEGCSSKERGTDDKGRGVTSQERSAVIGLTRKTMKDKQDEHTTADVWQEEEIFRLSEALHSLAPNAPSFWPKISQLVETRTAEECQLKYQEQLEHRNKRAISKPQQTKPAPKQGTKVTALTGGVGTLKRKRELRQLLEQRDDGYEDDIFDSTPFKKSKMHFKFPVGNNNDDDEEEEEEEEYDGDDHAVEYKTPSSRTPSSRYRPLGPASNTPSDEFISPGLLHQVNRNDMDVYIHRMKQGKRPIPAKRTTKAVKTSTPKKTTKSTTIPSMGSEIFDVHQASDRESDEDSDYYWSE